METVPITIDEDAFASTGDCEPLGLTAERLYRLLPELLRDADLFCVTGGKDRPAGHAAVAVREGMLLRHRVADQVWLMLLLHNRAGRMELVAIWPKLDVGGRLVARIAGLVKSSDGTQAHARLVMPDLPDHSGLCIHLSGYAAGAGLWERGGLYDFRIIGLPLSVRPADMAPILIGPDAPGYAAMVEAGASPEPDGNLAFQQWGFAAFFPREDLAPNACEFGGTVKEIRDGGTFFGTPYRIAEVTVFRSDDGRVEHQLSIAISEAVWEAPTGPEVDDDIMGVALLQGVAVGAIRQ